MLPAKRIIRCRLVGILTPFKSRMVLLVVRAKLLCGPHFSHRMAMAQFENDNFSYAAWDAFINARNLFNSYYDLIICLFAGTIIYDISVFIKINKGEN